MIAHLVNLSAAAVLSAVAVALDPSVGPRASVHHTRASAPQDSNFAKADRSRIEGDAAARVTLIIVQSYFCPHCRDAHLEMEEALQKEYVVPKKIQIAYMPIGDGPALTAAAGALCAGLQGKFKAMNHALFQSQDAWAKRRDPVPAFDTVATKVGLNMTAWRKCVASKQMERVVDNDLDRLIKLGVANVPTFIVGEQMVVGARLKDVRKLLDAELAKTAKKK